MAIVSFDAMSIKRMANGEHSHSDINTGVINGQDSAVQKITFLFNVHANLWTFRSVRSAALDGNSKI